MGVVLLHGFGDTPQTLASLARALCADGMDVDVPLLPGHGRTLREFASSNGSEWLAAARAAHAAMRARHARVALVGLSLGGALAAIVAADDPELAALVLLAPYVDTPPLFRVLVRAAPAIGLVLPYVGGEGAQSILDPEARAQALAYGATTPQLVRELVRLRMPRAHRSRASRRRRSTCSRARTTGSPRTVARRAFALLGARTKKLEMLSGCGHVLTVDFCRERVAALVRRVAHRRRMAETKRGQHSAVPVREAVCRAAIKTRSGDLVDGVGGEVVDTLGDDLRLFDDGLAGVHRLRADFGGDALHARDRALFALRGTLR